LAYVANRSQKRGHSVLWCVECGALCQRDDEGGVGSDLWQLPRVAVPKNKRPGR
jgi:hypothetical protein